MYEGKCARCGCEFTYTLDDVDWQATEYYWNIFDLQDWDFIHSLKKEYRGHLVCPYCNKVISGFTRYI